MIKVYYGEDRLRAEKAIAAYLGEGYETIEGMELMASDLPNIFWGQSLLVSDRSILVKDILSNKAVAEDLVTYLDSNYKIAFWETKLDKRSSVYKAIKGKVEFLEFAMPENPNVKKVFDVYRIAKTDGKKAVELLREIQPTQEPARFVGLMVSQAVKDYARCQGPREKAALKGLSRLDMLLKSTKLNPWTLIEAYLIELATWRA